MDQQEKTFSQYLTYSTRKVFQLTSSTRPILLYLCPNRNRPSAIENCLDYPDLSKNDRRLEKNVSHFCLILKQSAFYLYRFIVWGGRMSTLPFHHRKVRHRVPPSSVLISFSFCLDSFLVLYISPDEVSQEKFLKCNELTASVVVNSLYDQYLK